jgi:replicative DNA helicase
LVEVSSKISPNDFLDTTHKLIFGILIEVEKLGIEEFELHQVAGSLDAIGALEECGGYEYLDALFKSEVSKSNLDIYVNQILDASLMFKLEHELKNGIEYVRAAGPNITSKASEVFSKVEEDILSVSLDTLKVEDGKPIYLGLRERVREFELNPTPVQGLRSGFDILDRLVNGFKGGTLSVLAARPKTGKSTLLCGWSTHMCLRGKVPVLYIDTEMSTEEVQTRMLAHISGVPERIITNGLYINDERQREAIYSALEIMERMPYTHKYMPGFKIDDVKAMVRKYKAKCDIGAFYFDYIKMVELGDNYNETQTLGYLTSSLKDLAGTLNIPIITAVQLKRDSHEKSLVGSDDIADSDRVLRYCNLLMSLTHKSKKEIDTSGIQCGTHRLQILDNRGGSSLFSGIDLVFSKPILTIKEAPTQSSDSLLEQRQIEMDTNIRR